MSLGSNLHYEHSIVVYILSLQDGSVFCYGWILLEDTKLNAVNISPFPGLKYHW